jgi:hypothetical protein
MLPKRLPKPDLFFVDVRRMDDVLANWSQAWAALAPTAASPATSGTGFWVLSIRGTDPSLTYYSSPRAVSISYDPRGFLRSISEDLGDPNDMTEPRGSFRLTLDSTPPE